MNRYYKNHIAIAVVLLATLLFNGCTWIKPIEFEKINSLKVEQKKGYTRIKGNVSLFNPNAFSYEINEVNIDVFIEEQQVGKLIIPNKVIVESKSKFSGDCYIDVGFTKAIVLGATILPKIKEGQFLLQLKGDAKVSFRNVSKTIKLNRTEKIKL